MESLEGNNSNSDQQLSKPDPELPDTKQQKDLYLCLTGAQQHMVEKDVVKFLRKHLNMEDIPLKAVMKKRGQNFGFLAFESYDQQERMKELFMNEIVPKFPKMKIKEVNKKVNSREFKPVKDREEIKEEGERKKERQMKSLTAEEIAEEMKISVEDRVTPYHHLTYPEQIKKKEEQLLEVLKSFDKQLNTDITKNGEQRPAWYT